MRVLHFTYNTSGGAGKVAKELHLLFKENGIDSVLINLEEKDKERNILNIPSLDKPLRKFSNKIRYWSFRMWVRLRYKKKKAYNFSYNHNYRNLQAKELFESIPFTPDFIFLHWVSDFILPGHIKALVEKYNCPVIWRYNDLAPATGGCHYTLGCERYLTGCGECPALGSTSKTDPSHIHWMQKKEVISQLSITVINSTKHTEAVFKASPLFAGKRQEFIRNSLRNELYRSADRLTARNDLGIPEGKKLVFWGATYINEPRKGFSYLLEAIEQLPAEDKSKLILVIAGNRPANYEPQINIEHRFAGLLSPVQLVQYYNASEMIIVSSLEDGGPMMIVESLLCGTPVVSFATGLALELVITGETGYRAAKADAKDLAEGIRYILNLPPASYLAMQDICRQRAEALYGSDAELKAYQQLFADLKK